MKSCKVRKEELTLYGVTDRSWLKPGETLYDQCEQALRGGVTMLQLREKDLDEESFYAEAINLKKLCKSHKVPLIINDNLAVLMRSDVDGIHVGQSDMNPRELREIIGNDKILGVSAQTIEQALKAEREGADYLGVGAVFPTGTKGDAEYVSFETLRQICEAVTIPVVAIGGITKTNVRELSNGKIDGVAVVSEIFAAKEIEKETEDLYKVVKGITG